MNASSLIVFKPEPKVIFLIFALAKALLPISVTVSGITIESMVAL